MHYTVSLSKGSRIARVSGILEIVIVFIEYSSKHVTSPLCMRR